MRATFLAVHVTRRGKRIYKKCATQAEAKKFARTGRIR